MINFISHTKNIGMKKIFNGKVLMALIFTMSLVPFSMSMQSCSKKGLKTNKARNGGAKVGSSGHIGNRKHKNRHVWGK